MTITCGNSFSLNWPWIYFSKMYIKYDQMLQWPFFNVTTLLLPLFALYYDARNKWDRIFLPFCMACL